MALPSSICGPQLARGPSRSSNSCSFPVWTPQGITGPIGPTGPTGYTGYLIAKNVTVDASKVTDIYFFQRPLADDVTAPFTGTMRMVQREVNITVPFNQPFLIPKGPFVGPCDVGFMGKVSLTTGTASVEFELLLVQD